MYTAPVSATISLGQADDLPRVYEDMKLQFPPSELYPYKETLQLLYNNQYKLLLYKRDSDQALLGYALVYIAEDANTVWLDYIAVLKQYHGQGYGSAIFNALWQKYCGPFDALLFSVEHVCTDDPELARQQELHLKFYEKMGAYQLRAEYLQPTEDGAFPMYLYCKPRRGMSMISREVQMQTISQMYEYCFEYLPHIGELLPRFKKTIVDEFFTG